MKKSQLRELLLTETEMKPGEIDYILDFKYESSDSEDIAKLLVYIIKQKESYINGIRLGV